MIVPPTEPSLYQEVRSFLNTCPSDYNPLYLQTVQQSEQHLIRILHRFSSDPILFDIGLGWLPLVLDLDTKLQLISPHYTILKIKENFAGLRFYATYANSSHLNDEDNEKMSFVFKDLINYAETKSFNICEICARYAKKMMLVSGWYITRCEKHVP